MMMRMEPTMNDERAHSTITLRMAVREYEAEVSGSQRRLVEASWLPVMGGS